MIAAGSGASGMPLWLVCGVAFVAMLFVGLAVLLAPLQKKQRVSKQARLDEVARYRVLGAYSGLEMDVPGEEHVESALTAKALSVVDKAVRARGQRDRIAGRLERAAVRMRPEEWAAVQLAATIAFAAVGALLVGPLGLAAGVLGWLGSVAFLHVKTSRRINKFEAQLPDALQLLAGALRTGFAMNQAMGTVVREGMDPVSVEFGRALQEVRLGAPLEDALDDLAVRMNSYDMSLVVMAIRTAREVGGNLAEVLQTTVNTMRERVELRGQVRVLSAEGRFSAKVLIALPILMGAYLISFKKEYLRPLYSTGIGIALLVVGSTLLVLGSVWLSRMTKIEV